MSLTHLIKYDCNYKKFFKSVVPKKEEFKAAYNINAFSRDYIDFASYSFDNNYEYCLVGTAFDYLARWTIAKGCSSNREKSYRDLVAEEGLNFCQRLSLDFYFDLYVKYEESIKICKKYIMGQVGIEEIIRVSIFFAKLEDVFRKGTPVGIDFEYILHCENEVVFALEKLHNIFVERFISNVFISEKSVVVYNPTFGGASAICGGADADIYIDGTLYDFKCTNKWGYAWSDAAQILGYYLLDLLAKKYNDEDNSLNGKEIKRIAFYHARFGEVEYIDVSKEKYQNIMETFEQILGKEKYLVYLEEQKKRKEEEVIRKQKETETKKAMYKKLDIKVKYNGKKATICDLFNKSWMWNKPENEDIKTRYSNIMWTFGHLSVVGKVDPDKFEKLILTNKLTIDDLAEKMGVTSNTVNNWIKGKTLPKLRNFDRLLNILNCTQDDILIKIK